MMVNLSLYSFVVAQVAALMTMRRRSMRQTWDFSSEFVLAGLVTRAADGKEGDMRDRGEEAAQGVRV